MPVQIKINSVDKTSLIDWQSVRFNSLITNQVDTLNFDIKLYGGKTYKPELGDDIEFFQNSTKLFGGKVVEREEVARAKMQLIRVACKDHTHELDRKLVIKIYENKTVNFIINDIVTTVLPAGFTQTQVDAPELVNYIAFNYEQPSKCFQQLAELFAYQWYVDENKDIFFKSKDAAVAPFDLTDTNESYFYNSLVVKSEIKNLRNTIYVRGGEFKGTNFIEKETADGVAKVFKQGFRYSSIVVKKATVVQNVGIDNIDDPASYDCLYNFQEKAVKWRDDNKPTIGQEVEVSGLPHIPVIIKTKDNVSIGQYGAYEHKVIDKSINSKEGARDKAKSEVLLWAEATKEAKFKTKQSGLEVGQKIRIQSTVRNIDDFFIIRSISAYLKTPDELEYNVTAQIAEKMGGIEFLQKLLIQKDKEIQINADEVLDKIELAIEQITISESVVVLSDHNRKYEIITATEVVTPRALNYPTEFVLAPFPVPTGYKRELALDGGALA